MASKNYSFTVQGRNSLLKAARRSRGVDAEIDHVVEFQLIVAALNTLKNTTYNRYKGWEGDMVDFFNHRRNLQVLSSEKHQEKSKAVRKFISYISSKNKKRRKKPLTTKEKKVIEEIRIRWIKIKKKLNNFQKFKAALTALLDEIKTVRSESESESSESEVESDSSGSESERTDSSECEWMAYKPDTYRLQAYRYTQWPL